MRRVGHPTPGVNTGLRALEWGDAVTTEGVEDPYAEEAFYKRCEHDVARDLPRVITEQAVRVGLLR